MLIPMPLLFAYISVLRNAAELHGRKLALAH